MDTILILAALAVLMLFWKRPRRRVTGIALFCMTLASTVLLFKHHITSELPLVF
ncbi:hypothetical protein KL86DPRO_20419 [uncultured delta proteobacterium]|uniref:Uncharacterized protein n=1 Tax=uncultured delta proteobacterium TaxID=34034 RepID=A0A212K0K5_9DELT|nr:hypothetical protein KL86DPRO_20419 [uncultured delta proteobacterium]